MCRGLGRKLRRKFSIFQRTLDKQNGPRKSCGARFSGGASRPKIYSTPDKNLAMDASPASMSSRLTA